MSKVLDEVLAANASYVTQFGDKGNLPMPPGRSFAILTCMDARLDPANKLVFLKETPTSSEMPVAEQVTMQSVHWSFRTNCLERKNGSSSITLIAEWKHSIMKLWVICWLAA